MTATPSKDYEKGLATRREVMGDDFVDRALGNWGVGISGIAEAARWDDVANTLRVGGYSTLDARVSWHFSPGWTLQANLVNAFNKTYQTSAWYAQPGREWQLSLRWQPQQ